MYSSSWLFIIFKCSDSWYFNMMCHFYLWRSSRRSWRALWSGRVPWEAWRYTSAWGPWGTWACSCRSSRSCWSPRTSRRRPCCRSEGTWPRSSTGGPSGGRGRRSPRAEKINKTQISKQVLNGEIIIFCAERMLNAFKFYSVILDCSWFMLTSTFDLLQSQN